MDHYSAWLSTSRDAVTGDFCEVVVMLDDGPDRIPVGPARFEAVLSIRVDEDDEDDEDDSSDRLFAEAKAKLTEAGWVIHRGDDGTMWEPVVSGYVAVVYRVGTPSPDDEAEYEADRDAERRAAHEGLATYLDKEIVKVATTDDGRVENLHFGRPSPLHVVLGDVWEVRTRAGEEPETDEDVIGWYDELAEELNELSATVDKGGNLCIDNDDAYWVALDEEGGEPSWKVFRTEG